METSSFRQVMRELDCGEDRAAEQIVERFMHRLTGLARQRLDERLRAKVDPEDVLQSVYRSFFLRQQAGGVQAGSWDELWSLLAVITVRKCRRQARAFRQERRDIGREVSPQPAAEESGSTGPEGVSPEPTAEQAAVLAETLEQVLSGLDEQGRAVVVRKLQGETETEIAAALGRTERTVRRVLARVRSRLERIESENDGSSADAGQ